MALPPGNENPFREMSTNNEQTMAALNTLVNLALLLPRQQQSQVQQSAQILAQALGITGEETPEGDGDAEPAAEEEELKIVTTD